MGMSAYDSWKTTPPTEPTAASSCAQCGELLFEREEVYLTDDGKHYCKEDCLLEGLNVEKTYVEERV